MFASITRLVIFLMLLVSASASFALSQDPLSVRLPELQVIPKASWFWVGEHMALNGMPMSVKMFTYPGKLQDVIDYYTSMWKSEGHGKVSDHRLGSRVILGYELDGFYYTAQFEETQGQVKGKLVVTPTPLNYVSSKKTEIPLPPRSNVISKVESFDLGKRDETLSVESRFRVGYVVDFYTENLPDDGWKLISRGGDMENGAVLSFQRGSELLQLTAQALQHDNSQVTQFLIHWVK